LALSPRYAKTNEISEGSGKVTIRTPMALPKKSTIRKVGDAFAKEVRRPKIKVKKRVALKAVIRPKRTEPVASR
jgi:hypothetical protein